MPITLTTDGNWNQVTKVWTAGAILASGPDAAQRVRTVYQFGGLPGADSDTIATTFTLTLPGLFTLVGGTMSVTAHGVVSRHADPATGSAVGAYQLVEVARGTVGAAATDWVIAGNLATTAPAAERASGAAFNQVWRSVYRDGTGALARTILIVLICDSTGDVVLGTTGTATLTVTETTARTGLVGGRFDRATWRGPRYIECPKSGFDIQEDEAVLDGHLKRLVHPDYYDPPLPKPRPRRIARPYTANGRSR